MCQHIIITQVAVVVSSRCGQRGQLRTIGKEVALMVLEACTDVKTRQVVAASEGISAHKGHGIGQIDAGQRIAVLKGMGTDALQVAA